MELYNLVCPKTREYVTIEDLEDVVKQQDCELLNDFMEQANIALKTQKKFKNNILDVEIHPSDVIPRQPFIEYDSRFMKFDDLDDMSYVKSNFRSSLPTTQIVCLKKGKIH